MRTVPRSHFGSSLPRACLGVQEVGVVFSRHLSSMSLSKDMFCAYCSGYEAWYNQGPAHRHNRLMAWKQRARQGVHPATNVLAG